jgi:purine-binding chemotaxis protein CheW
MLVHWLDAVEILKSRQILDMMELPEVPRNRLLVKGVLESPEKSIPLMDTRVNLTAASSYTKDKACAVIVDVGGVEVGLILDRGPLA